MNTIVKKIALTLFLSASLFSVNTFACPGNKSCTKDHKAEGKKSCTDKECKKSCSGHAKDAKQTEKKSGK